MQNLILSYNNDINKIPKQLLSISKNTEGNTNNNTPVKAFNNRFKESNETQITEQNTQIDWKSVVRTHYWLNPNPMAKIYNSDILIQVNNWIVANLKDLNTKGFRGKDVRIQLKESTRSINAHEVYWVRMLAGCLEK
jgi:mRNA-degrading endonuclease HigB of HigAB toxin-antitoxin module